MAKILVVDDDAGITKMLRMVLGSAGHDVVVANDGAHGLVEAHEQLPDIILLDEKMPILDGSATLQALKASPKTQRIPVVMVTVENGNGYARRLFEMGVDMHVVKPFDPEEILDIIDRFVHVEAN